MKRGCSIKRHPRLNSFEEAEKQFNLWENARPRGGVWGNKLLAGDWSNLRPIYKKTTPHFMLRKNVTHTSPLVDHRTFLFSEPGAPAVSYDLILDDMTLVRYIRPTEHSRREVLLFYGKKSAHNMLAQHGWGQFKSYKALCTTYKEKTTDGLKVIVPLHAHVSDPYVMNGIEVPVGFSARLVFSRDAFKEDLLDTNASLHRPVYTYRHPLDNKQLCKQVLEWLAPVIDAALYRIPAMHAQSGAVPYAWAQTAGPKKIPKAARQWAKQLIKTQEELISRIIYRLPRLMRNGEVAQERLWFELRAQDVDDFMLFAEQYYKTARLHRTFLAAEYAPYGGAEEHFQEMPPFSAVAFRNGLVNAIVNRTRSGRPEPHFHRQDLVPLPLFPLVLPRKIYW